MNMLYIELFFIFQFMYGHYYFSNAEPLIGPSVRLAHENEFLFIVSIAKTFRQGEDGHVCTGALISRRHVLTSAHCLKGERLETFQVNVGSVDLRSSEQFSVGSWIMYDDWTHENNQPFNNLDNDIGIITLSRDIDNPRIVPATLSPLNTFELEGTSLIIAGWGELEGGQPSRFLRTVPVYVLSHMQCTDIFYRVSEQSIILPSVYICTRAAPSAFTTCGDSDGPLFTTDHQIVGINDAECNEIFSDEDKINFHLGIHYYRDFITDVLRQ